MFAEELVLLLEGGGALAIAIDRVAKEGEAPWASTTDVTPTWSRRRSLR